MPKSDSPKAKKRVAKATLLMFGEGLAEKAFLDHLKESYFDRHGEVSIKIKGGRGGSPKDIVLDAVLVEGSYDRKIVIIDNDRPENEMNMARQEAEKHGIELIEHTPCFEAFLLSILEPHKSFSTKTSWWCKNEFEANYVSDRKRADKDEYAKVFPKTILEQSSVEVLIRIIKIIKNQ